LNYTIIGRTKCTFCDKAKELLEQKGIEYKYYGIDTEPLMKTLILAAGHKTVPIVFDAEGKEIGGYTQLKELLND
jgi:glutaredoxin